MKLVKSTLAAAFALALAVAAPLRAADAPNRAHGALAGYLKCLGILNLTEDQKNQIKGIMEAAKPNLEALGQTLKADGEALKTLVQGTNPEPCAVGTALLKVHADGKALRDALAAVNTNIEAVLTADQKLKFEGCLAAGHPQGHGAGMEAGVSE